MPPEEGERTGKTVKALGNIDLTNSSVIVEKDPSFPENCFILKTPTRDYYISAADPFKMNTWISVLRLNSKLGTLVKNVSREMPSSQDKPQPENDEKYTLSFKLAADKMLKSLSDKAQSSRASLEDVATTKYEIKCQLKNYLAAVKTQRTESESKLKILREQETEAHQKLDSINALIVTLDKYLQASRYLQRQTLSVFSQWENMAATVRTLKDMVTSRKAAEIPKELSQAYLKLLAECFPPEKMRAEAPKDSKNSYLDVMVFYGRYYDGVHLPKHVQLEPAKSQRLDIWRQLVASVNGIKKTCQQLSELTLMEKEITVAITPAVAARSRPISMCDPDDDDDRERLEHDKKASPGNAKLHVSDQVTFRIQHNHPTNMRRRMAFYQKSSSASLGLSFYKSDWQGIAQVINALRKLRDREKEQSQKLDDALHSRELLASFSSKASPATSRSHKAMSREPSSEQKIPEPSASGVGGEST
uniref:PH domain-containing protein n=1 Tax=Lotharella globosa TaxID=91324 RepID=A0A7S3YFF5_9EUKA